MNPPEGSKERTVEDQIATLADLYSDRAEAYDSLWSPVILPVAKDLLGQLPLAHAKQIIVWGFNSPIVPLHHW